MNVLVYEPNKEPYVKEIKGDLKSMQELVEGYIKTTPLALNCIIVCNEEGLLHGLKPNRGLVETFFVCKSEPPEMVGLSDKEIEFVRTKFK